MSRQWLSRFPDLDAGLGDDDRRRLEREARIVTLPPGMRAFEPGSPCSAYLLVLDGAVRVQMIADTGREIVLYRVKSGETCVLTTACLLGEEPYAAEGIVEADTQAVAIPFGSFRAYMNEIPGFRAFVFQGLGRRLTDILATMESAVFHRVDARLARFILDKGRLGPIAATHQEIAGEIGTAREVISRHLKAFERSGLVSLARGEIRLEDAAGLRRICEREA